MLQKFTHFTISSKLSQKKKKKIVQQLKLLTAEYALCHFST